VARHRDHTQARNGARMGALVLPRGSAQRHHDESDGGGAYARGGAWAHHGCTLR